MKILSISLLNLNSLRGAHRLDFTESRFCDTGLFAMTGDTGAGKTTILDALTLALYGKVARDCEPWRMMSHGADECYAETEFACQNGQFRARWSLRRGRKAEGKLKPAWEVSRLGERAEILADNKKECEKLIYDLIQLDYAQFVRSVLLAQGDFAAFLKAKASERSDLLERITDTGIYSRLSLAAFEREKSERQKLADLQAQASYLKCLSPEEIEKYQAEYRLLSESIQSAETRARQLREWLDWRKKLADVENTLRRTETEARNHQAALAAFQPERERLDKHQQAAPLAQALNWLQARKTDWDNALEAQKKCQAQWPRKQADLQQAQQAAEAAARAMSAAQAEKDQNEPLIAAARALDGQIGPAQAVLQATEKTLAAQQRKLADITQKLQELAARWPLDKPEAAPDQQAAWLHTQLTTRLAGQQALLNEAEAHLDSLRRESEQARLLKHYEAARADLQPGQPCPLCGATEHPLVQSYCDNTAETQAKFLQQENKIKALRAEIQRLGQDAPALARLQADAGELQSGISHLAVDAQRAELDALRKQRRERFGERDPQAESRRLDKALESARQQRDQALAHCHVLENQATELRSRLAELDKSAVQYGQAYQSGLSALQEEAVALGFADLQALRAALLSDSAAAALQARAEALQNTGQRLADKLREFSAELAREQARGLTDLDENALHNELIESEQAQQARLQRIGALQHTLDTDKTARQEAERLAQQISRQSEIHRRWAALNQLIGSKDGYKFRNYAQGLTLAQLVNAANRHLRALNPRYLIARQAGELELEIIDLYQAEHRRPMNTLSGGESFLASLALALGLSDLASRHAEIGSLFIDEGFGTLDPDTLETALSALENLRANGKLIGIISHVPALRERIATQVRVIKQGNGVSRLVVE